MNCVTSSNSIYVHHILVTLDSHLMLGADLGAESGCGNSDLAEKGPFRHLLSVLLQATCLIAVIE